ncbi:MAG TPA: ATP-dependent metallopeptidase FtsH/Yme1/Tma family protein, partial [Streptosporangiaceae bacterium]
MSKQANPPPPGDKPAPTAPPPPPAWRHWLWPVALGIAVVLWILLPAVHTNSVNLTYTQFLSDVSANKVKTVTLGSDGGASGELADGKTYST